MQRNKTALLVESNNVEDFTNAIREMVSNLDEWKKNAKEFQQETISKFHYLRLASDMKSLYNNLLEDNKKS